VADLKSEWNKGYLEGGGIFFILAPIWMPIADGEGLQWPRVEDAGTYLLSAIFGAFALWRARRIKT
jgi:hypothetical protein